MGDARRSEKLKQSADNDEPVRAKRSDDAADGDTSHAERQLAMRTYGKGKGERAGFADEESVDHMFEGVGDQYDASREMERILDAGTPVGGLVGKVANLDATRREEVAKRIGDVAKIATGNEVLQIGDLVGLAPAAKIRAALASKTAPTQNALRAHAIDLSLDDRIALLDEPTRKLLEAKYAAPAEAIPGIAELGAAVRKHPDIVAWYLRTTPPRALALAILRIGRTEDEDAELAAVFNGIGLDAWQWALQLDAASVQITWSGTAAQWAKLTNQPDVAKHLEAIAPKQTFQKGGIPGGAQALRDLVPETGVDIPRVIATLHDARTRERWVDDVKTLTKSPYRERLIAAATLEQLELITNVMSLDSNDLLDWYLDSPHATPEAIRPMTQTWDETWVIGVADRPKLITKLTTKFPAAGPTDFFGHHARLLYPVALNKPAVRKWCTVNADARDLLVLVTQSSSSIAKMWKGIIDDGVAADWYTGLGTGVGAQNDQKLRMLALNTPDPAASTWIRHTLIGDYVEDKVSSAPKKVDAVAYEADAGNRLQTGLASDETADLGHRASELSDDEVAKLRANPTDLVELLPRLHDPWLLRNLLRIHPPLPTVLMHANLWDKGLPSFIRLCPASEVVDAFADDAIERRITNTVKAPFEVFPQLRDPSVLARVLARGSTLTWLLQRADVPYVMSLLAHASAGKAAAKVFTAEHAALVPDLLDRKEDRTAVEKFAAFLREPLESTMVSKAEDPALYEDEEDEEEADEKDEPPKAARASFKPGDVQARQDELEAALALGDLRKGLDLVLKDPVSLQNVLAVCRHYGSEAAKLVGKPEHESVVKRLREQVDITPLAVFPSVPYYAYFHTATSRTWLFEHESGMEIFREIANDPQLMKLVVDKLDATSEKDKSIDTWLSRMPTGTALTAGERKLVKRMFDEARTPIAARKLFEIRFGSRPSTTFSHDELKKLWQMLELVPDAHIEMGAVQGFNESKNLGGYSGLYSSGDHRIDIENNLINSNKTNTMFDQENELTREQLVAAYGYDDQQIKAKVAAGEIEEKTSAKGTRYIIKSVKTKLLDTTVLHEIGHAVDDMLGDRTEVVYGLAEWREFGESDIDELAKDLGGWDRVKPADQTQIKDAWAVWLNSRTDDGLDKFVPENHPALAEKYKGVGIVELARKKQVPGMHLGLMKGAYTIVNHKYQRFYRVPDKTRNAAPSSYAMTAPAEWFAECYAEYYREYAGPGTEDKKGGRLAGWIKGWFDQNIDNLKYNPDRKDR